MNPIVKSYRLINDTELRVIQQNFDRILEEWNDAYALHSLSCTVTRPTNPPNRCGSDDLLVKGVALLVQPDWKMLNHCLFGDCSHYFDAPSKSLFLTLLNQLVGTELLETMPINDWFYPGSPALVLTINQTMAIYLNPQWVLKALPLPELTQQKLAELDDALAAERVTLDVKLNALPLKLADVVRLKIGDVIKTDHPLSVPLSLSLNQKTICCVDIGKDNFHKSIQITRQS